MQQGTLAHLTTLGWFGFIVDPDGREIFFHSSALEGVEFEDLIEGDTVSFEFVDDDWGLRAVRVRRAVGVPSTMLLAEFLCAV